MMNTKYHKNTNESNARSKRIYKLKNIETMWETASPRPIQKSMTKQRF